MAEAASLAAAKLSVESGEADATPGEHYGLEACSAALAIAPLADSGARARIALIVENLKASLTANALQIPVPRSKPEISPALRSQHERLRAELMLLDEGEAERIPVQLKLRSTAAQIAREIKAQEIKSGYYARLVDSRLLRNIDLEATQQLLRELGPESTLLGTFERDDRAWIYAVWSEGSEIVELEDWPTFRRELVQITESVASGHLPAALAERISRVVLAPLRSRLAVLASESRVIISPYGAFQTFPFDTLITGGGYLCERVTLSLTPGLGTLHACLERPSTTTARLLAVGAPERTTPRPPPHSRDEIRVVEALYRSRGRTVTTLLGPDATPERLASHMPSSSIVHFACHAAVKDTDFPSRLLLSESFDTGESGIVTGDEIARSYSVAPGGLVVLAACETGRVDISLGHDSDALVSGFLQAGASSIVATRWPVQDQPTRFFMECFHDALLSGHTPAVALASTVRASLRGQLGPSLTDPSVWSAFALHGR